MEDGDAVVDALKAQDIETGGDVGGRGVLTLMPGETKTADRARS